MTPSFVKPRPINLFYYCASSKTLAVALQKVSTYWKATGDMPDTFTCNLGKHKIIETELKRKKPQVLISQIIRKFIIIARANSLEYP